jgi:hypothetical protein
MMSGADGSQFSENQIWLAAAILGLDAAELRARLNAPSRTPTTGGSGHHGSQQQPGKMLTARSIPTNSDGAAGHGSGCETQSISTPGLHGRLVPFVSGPLSDESRSTIRSASRNHVPSTSILCRSSGDLPPARTHHRVGASKSWVLPPHASEFYNPLHGGPQLDTLLTLT